MGNCYVSQHPKKNTQMTMIQVIFCYLPCSKGTVMKPGDKLLHPAPATPFPPIPQDITFTIPVPKCREVLTYSPEFDGSKVLSFTSKANFTITITVPKGLFQTYLLIRLH